MGPKEKAPKGPVYVYSLPLYEFMTAAEFRAIDTKNIKRAEQINESCEATDDLLRKLNKKLMEKEAINEWLNYVGCDGLPKPYMPNEIREFITKFEYIIEAYLKETCSWLLKVNEHSILSQNLDVEDLTRRLLVRARVDFGEEFKEYFDSILIVFDRLCTTIETRNKVQSNSILDDLKVVKIELQKVLKEFIDYLTLQIIRNENAHMESIGIQRCEYKYSTSDIALHLWSFRNVPITFDKFSRNKEIVNLINVGAKIALPNILLRDNLTVRGLHLSYDHYSDLVTIPMNTAEVKTLSLADSLVYESTKRKEMTADAIQKLKKEREVFLLYVKEKEKFDAANKAAKKEGGGEKKKGKEVYEPPIITENTIPDVEKYFLMSEEETCTERKNGLDPVHMSLLETEINLRAYTPVGGVYELHFTHKPTEIILPGIIVQWFNHPTSILEYDNNKIQFSKISIDDLKDSFVITFKVSPAITQFGLPIPCQFVPGLDLIQNKSSPINSKLEPIQTLHPVTLKNFIITDNPTKHHIDISVKYFVPQVLSSFQLSEEIDDEPKAQKNPKLQASEPTEEEDVVDESKQMPERLYPVFNQTPPIKFNNENIQKHVKTFSNYVRDAEKEFKIKQPKFPAEIADKSKLLLHTTSLETSAVSPNIKRKSSSFKLRGSRASVRRKKSSLSKVNLKKSLFQSKSSESADENVSELYPQSINVVEGTVRAYDIKDVEFRTKWSTKYIVQSEFNKNDNEFKIWTDRLGVFTFVQPRYIHFPFKNWFLEPGSSSKQIIFKVICSEIKVTIGITEDGYTCHAENLATNPRLHLDYLRITEPIENIKIFKEKFYCRNLNIFPEADTNHYVSELISEKHKALENHIHQCMAMFSKALRFSRSEWNRCVERRVILIKTSEPKSTDQLQIKMTPEDALVVEVQELCSPDINQILIEFRPTWHNIEFTADLNHVITNVYNNAYSDRMKNPRLFNNIITLLEAVKPFCFS